MNNTVQLLGYYGGDETHAMSAWTSTNRDITRKKHRIPELLKMLAENKHVTPFEKSMIHFLVTCDMASHIHIIKHRIAVSVNSESARYKELNEDKYYVPSDLPLEILSEIEATSIGLIAKYHSLLNRMVALGVPRKRAKESARFVLPYANQLTMDVAFNFSSFMHFYKLRSAQDAQLEIREIAENMKDLIIGTGSFNASLAAFGVISQ